MDYVLLTVAVLLFVFGMYRIIEEVGSKPTLENNGQKRKWIRPLFIVCISLLTIGIHLYGEMNATPNKTKIQQEKKQEENGQSQVKTQEKKSHQQNPYGDKVLHPATKQQLTDENYQNVITDVALAEKIATGEPVFVYVYSATCGYCTKATPKVMQSAKQLGITVYQFNLLEYQKGWETYKIEATPTLMLFKDKQEAYRLVGEREQAEYQRWFEIVSPK